MTIGLVLSQPPAYSETFFNSKIKGLQSHGVEVVLFVQEGKTGFDLCKVVCSPKVYSLSVLQFFASLGVGVRLLGRLKRVSHFVGLERGYGRSWGQVFKNCYTNAHLLEADVDWVHFGFATMALQSEHVAKAIGAQMAVSLRGFDMDVYPLKYPGCYDLLWKQVDKVHAISNYLLQRAYVLGMGRDVDSSVITPAIDIDKFKTGNQRRAQSEVSLISVCRLHWIKGLMETLEALVLLKKEGIAFRYSIIGEGAMREELLFGIYQLGLSDCVELLGALPSDRIPILMQEADICIQYSFSEGFCNAVLEAQASGCLCVVSDGGALPENVLDGVTGWVVSKGQPKLLAKTLKEVINSSDTTKSEVRTKAKERIADTFSLSTQEFQFQKFYKVTKE